MGFWPNRLFGIIAVFDVKRRSYLGYQEREMFEAFLTLPAPQRKIVREVIQTFAKAFPVETARKKPARD
jgi:hypothetical protein